MIDEEQKLYEHLEEKKKNGKLFTKDNLTYDYLYQLSIVENIPDSLIANLFDMQKSSVKNLRKKYDLANIFAKRIIDFPEIFISKFKETNSFLDEFNDEELVYYIYEALKLYAGIKKWNIDTIDRYISQKMIHYHSFPKLNAKKLNALLGILEEYSPRD